MAFTIPFIVDVFLVYATIKFWPREWENSPLIAENLVAIITLSFAVCLIGLWAFKIQFEGITDVAFWSGFILQLFISSMSIMQLLSRGSTRGHSLGIW
jgi:paspaline synthase